MFSYEPLFRQLKERNMTNAKFALSAGLDTSIINLILKGENIPMTALNKICDFLHCGIEDVRLWKDNNVVKNEPTNIDSITQSMDEIIKALAELKRYKELEAQGKLVILPCALGDENFWIADEDDDGNPALIIKKDTPIEGIALTKEGFSVIRNQDERYVPLSSKTIFFSREEALQHLLNPDE